MSKSKLLSFVLFPFLIFLGSYVMLVLFFSQQSGHILWENLLASAIFAAMLAFFAFICMFSKWMLIGWLVITLLAAGMVYLAGWESFSINYFHGRDYSGSCPVSFYCFDTQQLGPIYLLIKSGFEILFLLDVVVGFSLGIRLLVALNIKYPQTRYFMGTFILGLFALLLSLAQKIPDVPKYTDTQSMLLGLLGFLALISLFLGFFHQKFATRTNKFKRIYGAAMMASIFLIPLLIPFDMSSAEDQKAIFFTQILFGSMALFSFIYLGFFAKPRKIRS